MDNTITCSVHGTHSEIFEEIDSRRGTKRLRCKKCSYARVAYNRKRRKQELIEMFGGKCLKCGYKKCIEAIDFHHREPDKKEFQLSRFMGAWSKEKLIAEASKCDILCRNCHAEVETDRTKEIGIQDAIIEMERVFPNLKGTPIIKDSNQVIVVKANSGGWIPETYLGYVVILVT